MSQLFLRTNRTEGTSPLYVRVRRRGVLFCVSTGINVDIKEWNKSLKSKSAQLKYEATEEGKHVHYLEQQIFLTIDHLFKEDRLRTKEDKSILEEAIRDVVGSVSGIVRKRKSFSK